MTFYTSISGVKAAQSDLGVISHNLANVGSTGFKKSRAQFGDVFASSPTQNARTMPGQGTRLGSIAQQFTQGSLESTEKELDLAIAGDGFFVVRGAAPRQETSFTRNGAFQVGVNRQVMDTTGATLQLLPVDASGNVTSSALADATDFVLPVSADGQPDVGLSNVSVSADGLVTVTFADGSSKALGTVAMASFTSQEGLRPIGDAHWQSTGNSGAPLINSATNGALGSIRSGTLEHANVDVTEELVALISAQRNFQANAKAIETASTLTQTIINVN